MRARVLMYVACFYILRLSGYDITRPVIETLDIICAHIPNRAEVDNISVLVIKEPTVIDGPDRSVARAIISRQVGVARGR